MSNAEYIEDNPVFKVEAGQKIKAPTKLPLRLTKNNRQLLGEYMIEGALIPTTIAVGSAINESNREYSVNTMAAMFMKDCMYNSLEGRSVIWKLIETNLEGYYGTMLRMTGSYEVGGAMNTRNPTSSSLRAFFEMASSEDNLKSQPLSYRSWF